MTLNDELEQMEIDIEYGTFSRVDRMLRNKTSLNKFKNIEIISTTSSDNGVEEQKSIKRKKSCKNHKHMEAKQYVIKQPVGHQKKSKRK